jgi:chromosome segregation protein
MFFLFVMRLTSIKLSGFKSFAEPTNFQLPGQLVGVVGPNGCGKSNIMDAVRWVLGESKASELRGESMQDVIFNGSGQRKPASRASVELVFNNELSRAGGNWNRFAEIAVKRVLTRDGTSSYFINNQPVRRRDIQDVFLGTGLGPRAYAIIGQGTISRIIESKPEELRLFLEEAAGVSKYKERRRETEHRLRDTTENLIRVEDILRELNANLERLEKQAEVATRYHELQESGLLKLHQLWFLKHRDATAEHDHLHKEVLQAVQELDARMAELRRGEAELETLRQAHFQAGDLLHLAQGQLSEAALEVSRLEERIRYVVEGRAKGVQRIVEVEAQSAQWQERSEQAQQELETLLERMVQAQDHSEMLAAQCEEQSTQLPVLEDTLRAAQAQSADQRNAVVHVQQQIQILAAQGRTIEEQRRQLDQRREKIFIEKNQLAVPDPQRLEELKRQHLSVEEALATSRARLEDLNERLPVLDEQRRMAQRVSNEEATKRSELTARLEALRALQEKVQTQGKLQPWLQRHELHHLPGLWTQLHIESGWETGLEAALRERMGALAVGRLDTVQAFELDAPAARLAFYTLPAPQLKPDPVPGLTPLSDLVRLGDTALKTLLLDWLAGIYTARNLEEALTLRERLRPGETLITPQGHAVSRFAVTFYAPDSEQAGLLARAQEIENLTLHVRAQTLIADESRGALVRADAVYVQAAQRLESLRRESAETQNRTHSLQVDLLRLTQQAEQTSTRRLQIDEGLADLDAQMDELNESRAVGDARFEELDMQLATIQERHASFEDAVVAAQQRLQQGSNQSRTLERSAQEAQFSIRSLQARQAELQRSVQTAQQQCEQNQHQLAQLQSELTQLNDASAQTGLQDALALKLQRESALGSVRSEYDDLTLRMRRADEQRLSYEHSLQPLRERITKLQLEEQAAQLGGAQFIEQLQAAGIDLEVLAQGIEQSQVRLHGLQTEIDRINREIAALGAVNLAALEELSSSRERKQFLDSQMGDLSHAMQTLQDAIHKIDMETRDMLGQTFHQVNEHFGRMFPSLFGGGNARLVMTGDEILDAGVQVMAQPPGKKNSTIHLLSGGEKALTAIALVFAIFQLNPAPFCLLDEVDAPLDDANTERYANLVKEMSRGTQFLFISHNKIAMEMAQQLIGVTMQEQGVSRIVAVDMQAAVNMTEMT